MSEKKILIVDDDYDDLSLFTEALAAVEPKIKYYCAGDGHEAIEQLDEGLVDNPDIIFLDINMPVMNGWECLIKLKSVEKYKNIPIIIHTTSTRKADRQIAKELGAICFFTKPNDFKKLIKMLSIVVEKINSNAIDAICDAVYKRVFLN